MRLIASDDEQDETFLGKKKDCYLYNNHIYAKDCNFFREGTFFSVPCLPGV